MSAAGSGPSGSPILRDDKTRSVPSQNYPSMVARPVAQSPPLPFSPALSAKSSNGGSVGHLNGKKSNGGPADQIGPDGKSPPNISPFEEILKGEHVWTSRDIGRNFIASIFGDQQKSGKSILSVATDSLGPPLAVPTNLRKIRQIEFDPYLKSIEDVIGKYQLIRHTGLLTAMEGSPYLSKQDAEPLISESIPDLSALMARFKIPSLASLGLKGQDDLAKQHHKMASVQFRTRMLTSTVPPLEVIPDVYLKDTFNLNDPHTFITVTENADITSSLNGNQAATTSKLILGKIEHYLDIIEVHLIKEISRQSSSFFRAVDNLNALHNETVSCIAQITDLRGKLDKAAKDSAKKGLQVVVTKRKRGNLTMLFGSINFIAQVHHSQKNVQILMDEKNYVSAVDEVEKVLRLCAGIRSEMDTSQQMTTYTTLCEGVEHVVKASNVPRNLNLRSIQALSGTQIFLGKGLRGIGNRMEQEFTRILMDDIKETVESMGTRKISGKLKHGPASDWIQNILSNSLTSCRAASITTKAITPDIVRLESDIRSKLDPLVRGLIRMDRLNSAFQLYRDALFKDVKTMTKKYYPTTGGSPIHTTVDSPGFMYPGLSASMAVAGDAIMVKKQEKNSLLSKQLKSMDFSSYFGMLVNVYVTHLHILQRVAILHGVIESIIKDAEVHGLPIGVEHSRIFTTSGGSVAELSMVDMMNGTAGDDDDEITDLETPQVNNMQLLDGYSTQELGGEDEVLGDDADSSFNQFIRESSEILFACADAAHLKCAKVMGVRAAQNSKLNQVDFYRLFSATWEFVVGGESLCGRMCFGLKGTLLSQAKQFLVNFHEERNRQIILLVENEQWTQAEVPIDFQKLVEQILSLDPASDWSLDHGTTTLPSAEASVMDLKRADQNSIAFTSAPPSMLLYTSGGREAGLVEVSSRQSLSKPSVSKASTVLVIEKESYYVVGSLLLLLKSLTDYVVCVENISVLSIDIVPKMIALLNTFNSKACQVVLGGGAVFSAGLKSINAKHVVLTADTLGAVMAILPHIKNVMSKFIPPKHQALLSDFDKLAKAYREHQDLLYDKLVELMEERVYASTNALKKFNWDNPDPKEYLQEENVTMHTWNLVKETINLHKLLLKFIKKDLLRKVMANIFTMYNEKLGEEWKTLDIFSSTGKTRLFSEAQYVVAKLSELDGIDGPGNSLETVVNNIKIKELRTHLADLDKTGSSSSGRGGGGTTGAQVKSSFSMAFSKMLKSQHNNLPPSS